MLTKLQFFTGQGRVPVLSLGGLAAVLLSEPTPGQQREFASLSRSFSSCHRWRKSPAVLRVARRKRTFAAAATAVYWFALSFSCFQFEEEPLFRTICWEIPVCAPASLEV